MEEKRRHTDDVADPSKALESRSTKEKGKENVPAFKLASDIEQPTDLQKVFKERIQNSRVEFSLQGLRGVGKKEFHKIVVDLMKRRRQAMEDPSAPKVNVAVVLMSDTEVEDEIPDSHYMKPQWALMTTETPVQIKNVTELVVSLIYHRS